MHQGKELRYSKLWCVGADRLSILYCTTNTGLGLYGLGLYATEGSTLSTIYASRASRAAVAGVHGPRAAHPYAYRALLIVTSSATIPSEVYMYTHLPMTGP